MLHDAKTEKRADNFPMGKFINAFSHDLKEPVRTSLSYIQLLERKVNKEGAEYVSIIATEMKRMDNLLQNMKMAMSSDDEPLKLSTVNVRSVLESVFKQLKKEIDAADAMIDLSTMPEVQADERKLSVVFTHLIENAVKFRKKDKRCFIEILLETKPTETIFCVKDNGIGIDQKYHQEIFQPFYRLISFDENPANGLGLYICKSIIEQHKGKIWVESREGFGTSAFFTIPR
jgi:chemotaxis family two-component system sensor kinase Cph1